LTIALTNKRRFVAGFCDLYLSRFPTLLQSQHWLKPNEEKSVSHFGYKASTQETVDCLVLVDTFRPDRVRSSWHSDA
ncbi:MAG: hypothetical protein L0312_08855, partial [Acidobacteria bacterium]|nr:hypothetical protein [Acidobacteriota bacterium]